jgi:hypothetical protein
MTSKAQKKYNKEYYEKTAETRREKAREYYEKNRERVIARVKSNPTYNNYPSKYIL